MKAPTLAEAAIDLPWLSPNAASLVALVRLPAALAWSEVRSDPGLLLLMARRRGAGPPCAAFVSEALRDPALLKTAGQCLRGAGFADWNHQTLLPIYQTCIHQAHLAQFLASRLKDCDPQCAWMAGLLAPLGWLAAAAVDAGAVHACLQHGNFFQQPAAAQQQCWGLEHAAVARRLCRRWSLPAWLGTVIGHLGLPAGIARSLGADGKLFQVVQLAVGLIQNRGGGLGLTLGATTPELMTELALDEEAVDECLHGAMGAKLETARIWQAPASLPLLAEYLQLALEQRCRDDLPLLEKLHNDVDQLQHALEVQCSGETARLNNLKLGALAELAAGAGHEINNPLAVISGQAQYLMGRETDPERCKALQAIIGQAKRIHQILAGLMQFARPAPAHKIPLDAGELIQNVAESLAELADQQRVRMLFPEPPAIPGRLVGDSAQVQLILTCLLRNAIEAAPVEGWAGIRVEVVGGDCLEFIVEDNGAGPTPAAREHMFDPFFSGRSAGRGRGMGLATAWRLAQQNGGTVHFDEGAPGLSRFVFRLPLVHSLPNLVPTPETVMPDNNRLPSDGSSNTLKLAM